MHYAGIGAQKTPEHFQHVFHSLAAYLYHQGITLRTGGAYGADSAFLAGVRTAQREGGDPATHQLEVFLPWRGFNNHPVGGEFCSPSDHPFTDEEFAFAKLHHPNWKACSPSVRSLHARNGRIILGHSSYAGELVTPVDFAICWTEGGKVTGGTGQALRMLQKLGIKVFNFGVCASDAEVEQLILNIHVHVEGLRNVR